MNLIETSLKIALDAYSGKKDKAGMTYILHPLRVMEKMDTEEEMSVAILHDVIEDSAYTHTNLLNAGIPVNIVEAVIALSKTDGEDYNVFIERVLQNPLASKVKKADIEDNINILRLKEVHQEDLQRLQKYHRAWLRLKNNPHNV
ncbi:MAG: hypothetical protein KAH22_01645 [Thiotrichaceae bacterium]|nr:hypothetical protein [Thiotrichaceae bacterium]